MAKDVTSYSVHDIEYRSKTLKSGGAAWVKGTFVGIDQWGDPTVADFRNTSPGPVFALGVAIQNAEQKDPKGNVLTTIPEVSWTRRGKIVGLTNLTAGAVYYLGSGGGISASKVASLNGMFDQVVGVAMSSTELSIEIGAPVVKG